MKYECFRKPNHPRIELSKLAWVTNQCSTTNWTSSQAPRSLQENKPGIQGPMRSFTGWKTFSGSSKKDLDSTIYAHETMINLCEITNEDRLKE